MSGSEMFLTEILFVFSSPKRVVSWVMMFWKRLDRKLLGTSKISLLGPFGIKTGSIGLSKSRERWFLTLFKSELAIFADRIVSTVDGYLIDAIQNYGPAFIVLRNLQTGFCGDTCKMKK